MTTGWSLLWGLSSGHSQEVRVSKSKQENGGCQQLRERGEWRVSGHGVSVWEGKEVCSWVAVMVAHPSPREGCSVTASNATKLHT